MSCSGQNAIKETLVRRFGLVAGDRRAPEISTRGRTCSPASARPRLLFCIVHVINTITKKRLPDRLLSIRLKNEISIAFNSETRLTCAVNMVVACSMLSINLFSQCYFVEKHCQQFYYIKEKNHFSQYDIF